MSTSSPEVRRALRRTLRLAPAWLLAVVAVSSCTTLPTTKVKRYKFPTGEAFVANSERPYKSLGLVRTRVDYSTLAMDHEEDDLCRNYYNKAVQDLVKRAKDHGGDAVIDVKTVVFFDNGKHELHSTPECSDDGSEGQVLAQGIAVKWLPRPVEDSSKPSVSTKDVLEPAKDEFTPAK